MAVAMFAYAALALAAPASNTSRPPNIVLVFADDLGYGDVGCFGGQIPTPHLDQLARDGIRFTDFYVAQAVCSASRAALLTGCYPNRIGLLGALGPSSRHGIHARETTLAEVLKTRDYATAIYGKWHLGHQEPFLPTRHGFDDYYGLPYSNDMGPLHPTIKFPALPLIERARSIAENPDQSRLTTDYTRHAVEFINRNRDRPFFLYLPHTMPHVPLFVSEHHRGKSGKGLYGDVVLEIDWSMGEILAALRKHDLVNNTLVIFTSDNGPWLSYGNHAGSAGPLREGKGTTWDGGVRVPFLARWPGKIPAGTVCKSPAMTIDLLPTLARLAGAELPKLPIDGRDIGPLLLGQPDREPDRPYYFYWGGALEAVRAGAWKLHFPHAYRTLAGKPGGKDGKPVEYAQGRTSKALYRVDRDPGETTDVADADPEVVRRLEGLAEAARRELGDTAHRREGAGLRPAAKLAP